MRCPPLICTDGIASAAALDLIRTLAEAGCEIHARADFDTPGHVVMDQIRSVAPQMIPWRFDIISYRAAAGSMSEPDSRDLAAACANRPIHEETLLPQLLEDLSSDRVTPGTWEDKPCFSGSG